MTSQSQRPPMDPVVVDTLLEALSNDDDFRALFVRDPRAALAKAGHVADDQDALRCLQFTTLASKQELAEARKALRSHLLDANSGPMTIIFNFEAGQVQSSLSGT